MSLDAARFGWQSRHMASIEPSEPSDVEQVHSLSKEVFGIYGDYSKVLPRFFSSQGVTTYVARAGDELAGFIMLGFLPWSQGAKEGAPWIADLLAIAVAPKHQRKGIGGRLMQQVLELVEQMSEWRDVREIHLTCAESNNGGMRFFERHGFKVVDPDHGSYSSGQKAVRMARPFPSGQ